MKFSGYMIQVVLFSPKLSEDKKEGLHQKLKDISSLNRVKTKKRVLTAICTVFGRKWWDLFVLTGTFLSNHQRWSRRHKARGQGQGHIKISRPRPRTDSLEAKTKDQGHRRKCSPKKRKGLQKFFSSNQRWSRGHKARGQGQGHKKIRGQGQPFEDRTSRGQGQECSRPRPRTKDTGASVLPKKKKMSSKIFFRRSPIHWRTQNF